MDAAQRITTLLQRIDAGLFGPVARMLLDEVVTLADTHGLDEIGYAARLRLLASAARAGDTEAQLSAFAWCVARNAGDPVRFPATTAGHDLLWYHKHVVDALVGSPVFTIDDVEAAIDEMDEQFRRAGVGLSAVWQARFQATVGLGRFETAAGMLTALRRTPRDAYSHCAVCARAEEAEFHYLTGDDRTGLALADEILSGRRNCGDEPHTAISHALLPLLRTGRVDARARARQLHLEGYRAACVAARNGPGTLPSIAGHLLFCAATGNEARGLEILEQHLGRLPADGLNQRAHLRMLSAIGVLLSAAERAGAGDQQVPAAAGARLEPVLGVHQGPWSVTDLRVALGSRARDLAARFDQRNGNDVETRSLERDLRVLDLRLDLPLATRAAPGRTGDASPEQVQAQARALRAEAENLADKDPARALIAARAGLRLALTLSNRELTVGTARFGAIAAMTMGEDEAAIEFCRIAVREAAAAELPGEPSFRLELGSALVRGGRAEDAVLEIEEAMRQLRAAGAPAADLALANFQLGRAETGQGHLDDARLAYRNAVALASVAGDHAAATRYGLAMGELLLSRDDPKGLTVLAGSVVSARNLASDPQVQIGALHVLGRALVAMRHDELAERVLREALHTASRSTEIPAVRYEHADVLDSISRAISNDPARRGEAIDLARRAAEAFAAASAGSEAGRALLNAASMLADDRPGEALTAMEQAAGLASEHPPTLVACLDAMATLLSRLGRDGEAHLSRMRADDLRDQLVPGRCAALPD